MKIFCIQKYEYFYIVLNRVGKKNRCFCVLRLCGGEDGDRFDLYQQAWIDKTVHLNH